METAPGAGGFQFDARTIEVIKWSAIFNAAQSVIGGVLSYLAARFLIGGLIGGVARLGYALGASSGYYYRFPVESLVRDLIWSAVIGAAIGFAYSRSWSFFQKWNQKTFKFNSLFKFIFVWHVIISVGVWFLFSWAALFIGFTYFAATLAITVLEGFIYAKGMDIQLGNILKM